jgi:hypothetical protein
VKKNKTKLKFNYTAYLKFYKWVRENWVKGIQKVEWQERYLLEESVIFKNWLEEYNLK